MLHLQLLLRIMQFHGSILQSETISKETTDSYFQPSRYFSFQNGLGIASSLHGSESSLKSQQLQLIKKFAAFY
jgi:hypothetical protein